MFIVSDKKRKRKTKGSMRMNWHGIANNADPDQTAPRGAVWSGSALSNILCFMFKSHLKRNSKFRTYSQGEQNLSIYNIPFSEGKQTSFDQVSCPESPANIQCRSNSITMLLQRRDVTMFLECCVFAGSVSIPHKGNLTSFNTRQRTYWYMRLMITPN